jgi:hypothetical protein
MGPLIDSAKKDGIKIKSELLDDQGESEAGAIVNILKKIM